MRKKLLIKLIAKGTKEVLRSSITLSLLLSGFVLCTKYPEVQIDLQQIGLQETQTDETDETMYIVEEDEKISVSKVDVPYTRSSFETSIMEQEKVKGVVFEQQMEIGEYILLSKAEKTEVQQYVTKPYMIECTAYIPSGNPCRDGTYPVEGITVAGKEGWLGRHCNLYYCTDDGQIGELIGTYTFHDTGFGHDPDGDGIGSIETGERIDLFMESYQQAMNWGVRYVYIEFLD